MTEQQTKIKHNSIYSVKF